MAGRNVAAFDALLESLRSRDALLAPDALVELGRSLAGDMDDGEAVHCQKCKTPVGSVRNAALVKQYREVIGVLTADDHGDDDAEIWEQFHQAGRP